MERPQEIIVFVVGGITYEETLAIHNINKAYSGSNLKVIIGGTFIHNFNTFMDEVLASSILDKVSTIDEIGGQTNTGVRSALASAMRN